MKGLLVSKWKGNSASCRQMDGESYDHSKLMIEKDYCPDWWGLGGDWQWCEMAGLLKTWIKHMPTHTHFPHSTLSSMFSSSSFGLTLPLHPGSPIPNFSYEQYLHPSYQPKHLLQLEKKDRKEKQNQLTNQANKNTLCLISYGPKSLQDSVSSKTATEEKKCLSFPA